MDINYSMDAIDCVAESCYWYKTEGIAKLKNEANRVKDWYLGNVSDLKSRAQNAKSDAQSDISAAEDVCNKNDKIKEKLLNEKKKKQEEAHRLQSFIKPLDDKIKWQESEINSLMAAKPRWDPQKPYASEVTAWESNYNALVYACNGNKNERKNIYEKINAIESVISKINAKVGEIDKNNDALGSIKNDIAKEIVKIERYISACDDAEHKIDEAFKVFENDAEKAGRTFDELYKNVIQIKDVAKSALRSASEFFEKNSVNCLVIENFNNLNLLSCECQKTNNKLNENADKLMESTQRYRKNIKDNVSEQVAQTVNNVDRNLKNVYWILKKRANALNDLTQDLSAYLGVKTY